MHTIYYAHVHVSTIYMIVQFTYVHVYMQYCVHCKYDCLSLSPTAPSSTSTDGGQQEIRADDPAPQAGRKAQTESASSGRVWPVWFRPVLEPTGRRAAPTGNGLNLHVLVKVPARVLYGNYWARGIARARSASATCASRTFPKPNNFRRVRA